MGPPMPSRTTSNSPSTAGAVGWGGPAPRRRWRGRRRAALRRPPGRSRSLWPGGRAEGELATRRRPGEQDPVRRRVLARRRMPAAVTPADGQARPRSRTRRRSAAARSTRPGRPPARKPPPPGTGQARARRPKVVTPSPRAATVPATSQPMTVPGGCLPAARTSPRLSEAASMSRPESAGAGCRSGTSARDMGGRRVGHECAHPRSLLRRRVPPSPARRAEQQEERPPADLAGTAVALNGQLPEAAHPRAVPAEVPAHGR